VRSCAALLDAAPDTTTANDELVLLRPGKHVIAPLVLVHPIGGQVSCYLSLVNHLNYPGPVYGLQKCDHTLDTVEHMAQRYIDKIRQGCGALPRVILGWSFGGVVAYEMARRLTDVGEKVDVIMLDSFNPGALSPQLSQDDDVTQPLQLMQLLQDMGVACDDVDSRLQHKPMSQLLPMALQLGQSQGVFATDYGVADLTAQFALMRANDSAFYRYRPQAGGDAHLLRAAKGPNIEANGWQNLPAKLSVFNVEDDHFGLIRGQGLLQTTLLVNHIIQSILSPNDDILPCAEIIGGALAG
jgi:thioesterase domain-containing protein